MHLRAFLLAIMCLSNFALIAHAAAAESKVWFVEASSWTEQGTTSVSVFNLDGEPALANVRAFTAQGEAMPSFSKRLTVSPGQAASASVAQASYVLVIATRPVIVTARTTADMKPSGGSGAAFPRYFHYMPAAAYPIDCTGAPPSHFACSQRAPGNFQFKPPVDFNTPQGTSKPTPN